MIRLFKALLAPAVALAANGLTIDRLHAESTAPIYVVIEISDIKQPEQMAIIVPKAGLTVGAFGGRYVIRTSDLIAGDGTPPTRLVVVAFDTLEHAEAWRNSAGQSEVLAMLSKAAKYRLFFGPGYTQ